MSDLCFVSFPKIPRLFKDCVITEKIDGTNACVVVVPAEHETDPTLVKTVKVGDVWYDLHAQSRNRFVLPGKQDNAGFAGWVERNALALAETLGQGHHFGEWYGQGIQRTYGLDHKRFALFNTARWANEALEEVGIGLETVPVLYHGPFDVAIVRVEMLKLKTRGSAAVPGYMNPEGVMVYHQGSGTMFKAPFDPNPKGQ